MAQSKGRYTSDEDFLSSMKTEMNAPGETPVRFFLATDNHTSQQTFLNNPMGAKVLVFDSIDIKGEGEGHSGSRHTSGMAISQRTTKVLAAAYASTC
eukprot:m.64410 g.64410  ORF g.64410 m.64410 type:complete len:97 (-) comp15879_c0_seq3:154-444(-)